MKRRVFACLAVPPLLLAGCSHLTAPRGSPNPAAARIVTEDIPRFWGAFDAMTSATDTMPLRTQYLDRGTIGLTDFTNARWKSAKTLTAMVWPLRSYYASIRQNTLTVERMEPALRRAFQALDTMYDGAVFPDVYFAIGGMSTGGTTSNDGLLIGIAMAIAVETVALHLFITSRWGPVGAWVLTATSVYSLLWLVGDFRARTLRPPYVTADVLVIRNGMRADAVVPRAVLSTVERVTWRTLPTKGPDYVHLARPGEPNVVVHFREPVTVALLFGRRRRVSRIGIRAERPDEAMRALSQQ